MTNVVDRPLLREPRLRYSYDPGWRPTQACSSQPDAECYVSNATYTALDQPVQQTLGNALVAGWFYQPTTQRLSQLRVGTSTSPGIVFNRTYTYDPMGNVATINDLRASPDQLHTFTYDARDRLTHAETSGNEAYYPYTEAHTYNTIGNLTRKDGVRYHYPTSGLNATQPHAVTCTGTTDATCTTGARTGYTYDATGNTTRVDTYDSANTLTSRRPYIWNSDNQPTSIEGTDGVVETYTYDADGERWSRTRAGVTTYYVGGLLEEEPSSGTTRILYAFNGQVVAQRTRSASPTTLLYLHGDHLGSISATTDSSGPIQRQEYTPWGEARSTDITTTSLDYTGQCRDGTGLFEIGAGIGWH